MNKKFMISITILLSIISFFSGCTNEKTPEKPIKPTTAESARYFMMNLSENNYDKAYSFCSNTFKNIISIDQLQSTWKSIIDLYGNMQDIIGIEEKSYEDYNYILIFLNTTFSNDYYLIFKVVFNQENQIEGFFIESVKPITSYVFPSYVNPDSFTEFDVVIGSKSPLPATISIPKGPGPFPAVVLVHGSGPNDRDETIGPNKPFKDIAGGLATKGIAVLRYDKRTYVYPNETFSDKINTTPKTEVIDDAIASIDFLSNHELIDAKNIIIVGHSLGAMMAPKIAFTDSRVKAVICLAAPARSLEDLILNQYNYLFSLDDKIDESEQKILDQLQIEVLKIKNLNISDDELVLNAPYAYWAYLSTYDPVETAMKLNISFLFLQGLRDYQVTYNDDFMVWKNAFLNKTHATFITYENLNHIFISGEGIPNNTEYFIKGNVEEQVIIDIASWIKNVINE
ncbi:MAG: alpha/beta hydrolase [Thermoplasmatota archaeon]